MLCPVAPGDGALRVSGFLRASATELIDSQYVDRPHLRPIFDSIVNTATALGDVIIQARKTYVSLVTARRTFARVQPTTKTRVDLGLRLDGHEPEGRLMPSKIHDTMKLQMSLTTPGDLDSEAKGWLKKAYVQNS